MINPAARLAWTETTIAIRFRLLRGSYSQRVIYARMAEERALETFTSACRGGRAPEVCMQLAYETASRFLDNPNESAT